MNTIPSRLDIKSALTNIAKDSGYEGATVDLLISLLSTGYYESLLRSILINRESNKETAVNYNSLLSLACSKMYSAYRGRNRRALLLALSDEVVTLKRGDILYRSEDFNIFVEGDVYTSTKALNERSIPIDGYFDAFKIASDIVVQASDNVDQDSGSILKYTIVPVVIAKNFYKQEFLNRAPSFGVEFLLDNLSEDILIRAAVYEEGDWQEGSLAKLFKEFSEFIKYEDTLDAESTPGFFDLTIPSNGVRLCTTSKLYEDASLELTGFDFLSEDYLTERKNDHMLDEILNGLEFNLLPDSKLLISEKDVNDFLASGDSDGDLAELLRAYVPITITSNAPAFQFNLIDKESSEELRQNLTNQVRNLSIIRSFDDLRTNTIEFFLNRGIHIKDVKFNLTYDSLDIHYITDTNSEILAAFRSEFESEKQNYFLNPSGKFNWILGEEVSVKVSLSVEYYGSSSANDIVAYINNRYGYKFDTGISLEAINTYIAKLPEVKSFINCSLTYNGNAVPELNDNQYYIFSI